MTPRTDVDGDPRTRGTGVTRSPGRPPMPIDRISETALQIIDGAGLDGLSMRAIASQLNSSTATLYRHFPTRGALIVSVIDRVLGEVDTRAEIFQTMAWQPALRQLSGSIFEAFRRHRQAALLLADHTPVGPNAAAVRERTLGILIDAGFEVPVAARAAAMVGHLILGFAIQMGGERETTEADREAFRKAIQTQDLAQFPATAAVKQARWRPTSVSEEFAFALELVLDGLSLLRGRDESERH